MTKEKPSRLLIVDDDPELLRFLLEELSSEEVNCVGANCGVDALMQLRQESFDLVVLDWSLPDFDGIEICRRLRLSGDTTPMLMLTAHDDLEERVQALDLGADDYISKPFELKELHARVRARLRRRQFAKDEQQEDHLELGDLRMDLLSRVVHRGKKELSLSQREFNLLRFLVKRSGQVLKRLEILEGVWGAPFVGDPNTLDVYMGYLRRKIEHPESPQLIHTIRGVGFMARVEESND